MTDQQRVGVVGVVLAALVLMGLALRTFGGGEPAALLDPPPAPDNLASDTVEVALKVRSGTTLGVLLSDYDLSGRAIREAALELYDLAKIRPDRDLSLVWRDGETAPVGLRYAPDDDTVIAVDREGEVWTARKEEVVYETAVEARSFQITRSLWQDGLAAGLAPVDLVTLAGIFEYTLDFNTELREGASIALVADVLTAPGRQKLGAIHAVRLINKGKHFEAVRYAHADGETEGYYQKDGSGLRRPFLRSPLKFSRVTSGFNPRRFHPVLKKPRPHNGTDFGAPVGTPVRAVADAVVSYAAYNGGHGMFVKLNHENAYETSYSHLSSISVRKGQRVKQGQLLGKVGSTGLSTGPHLHYQMWKNGRYVDAMSVDLPFSQPLPSNEKGAFQAEVTKWLPLLPTASASPAP